MNAFASAPDEYRRIDYTDFRCKLAVVSLLLAALLSMSRISKETFSGAMEIWACQWVLNLTIIVQRSNRQ